MAPQPIIALMYDFDNTLSTEDMQDYSFIPSLGLSVPAFWQLANEFGRRERMDGILAYMFTMIRESLRPSADPASAHGSRTGHPALPRRRGVVWAH